MTSYGRVGRGRVRVVWSWIASFAVLFMAMAPSVSEVIDNARAAAPFEICTMGGRVDLDRLKPGHPADSGHVVHHCSYCALGTHGLAPPPAPLTAWAFLAMSSVVPRLFLHASHTGYAWISAQPRAPPILY